MENFDFVNHHPLETYRSASAIVWFREHSDIRWAMYGDKRRSVVREVSLGLRKAWDGCEQILLEDILALWIGNTVFFLHWRHHTELLVASVLFTNVFTCPQPRLELAGYLSQLHLMYLRPPSLTGVSWWSCRRLSGLWRPINLSPRIFVSFSVPLIASSSPGFIPSLYVQYISIIYGICVFSIPHPVNSLISSYISFIVIKASNGIPPSLPPQGGNHLIKVETTRPQRLVLCPGLILLCLEEEPRDE